MNPLFPEEPTNSLDESSYLLPRGGKQEIKPPAHGENSAVTMIRHKIAALYANEPNAKQEVAEVARVHPPRSKHQEFMYRLTTSGRSMAEIQTAWHDYYTHLPDPEKHQVWQEFYHANAKKREAVAQTIPTPPAADPSKPVVVIHEIETPAPRKADLRSAKGIKRAILKRIRSGEGAHKKAKQHLQSLAFGIGMGALALLIALFGLFNELIIAPFIRPGSASAAPIILNVDGPAPSSTPEVIIPKLNAQLPVIYGGQSLDEREVQNALEGGVYHYPTTATPGQNGNVAIFGHSSNNIFNKGKYKFAFVLLHEMEPGDIFYLTYEGKVYAYKVFSKKVVNPDETWVLGAVEGKTATAALITCDPPGSTRHRLVVWGEQVSPDPVGNTVTAEPSDALQTQNLPDNGPSMWRRFTSWINPFD